MLNNEGTKEYYKPTANIIVNGKKLSLSNSWNKTRKPTLSTFSQHSIESPAQRN